MAEPTMASVMLEFARRDAVAYWALATNVAVHDSILGFHAQQAIEKAIKAVLFKHSVQVPRTHHIDQLLDVLDDAGIAAPPHAHEIDSLNPYAAQARYGTLDTGQLDRQQVEAWLTEVLVWADIEVSCAE